VSTTTANARMVLHYNETFPEPITRTAAPNTSYDAFYLAAFATYAAGREAITGASLARAMARLVPPGTPVDVGPSGVFAAYTALARGEHVDVNGTTGPLDFDLTTGEAAVDLAVLCAEVDARGAAIGNHESGQVYAARTARLEGEPRCP
jgi:branched-chain amino acid transport system substrate-binding protein